MANIETTVNELVINQLSKTKYEELKSAGSLQENQLYMVEETESSGGGVTSIDGATGEISLGNNLHIENNILSATNTVTTLGGIGGTITLGDGLSMDGTTLKLTGGGSVSGDYLPLSGGTLTGNLIIKDSYLQAYYAGTGLGLVGNQILSQTINNDGSYSNVAQFKFDANGIEDTVNHKTFATTEYVDSKVPNIVASSTEPESPVEGMIWIQISE
nr:MAG TPA: hypothetical protein [Caudoviricetes sp.]